MEINNINNNNNINFKEIEELVSQNNNLKIYVILEKIYEIIKNSYISSPKKQKNEILTNIFNILKSKYRNFFKKNF
jgi:hypothetical protein